MLRKERGKRWKMWKGPNGNVEADTRLPFASNAVAAALAAATCFSVTICNI
jgi:hypothetical protein